jgi:choline dehydrogenase
LESIGEFDYIIVGAGTAGCLLANRLTSDPNKSVLLVEAGPKDSYAWIHIPVGYLYCIGNPQTDWLFKTEPVLGLGGRSLNYARGKVLGGSSSINGMVYMRGQSHDYDRWSEFTGDTSWRWDNVLPLFMQTEDHYKGRTQFHGHGGEWRVERQRLSWEILDAFRDAAEEIGIHRVEDFNSGDNSGCGYFEVNQRRGVRVNTAKAFLRPISNRKNLTVLTDCTVERLLISVAESGSYCHGVEYVHRDRKYRATTRREVILAAGTVGSPHILQLSGIGPAAHLHRHGVSSKVDLPGVGENLQDHLQLRSIYRFSGAPSLNVTSSTWLGKARIGLQYALFRKGPMSMAPSQLGAFAYSDGFQASPNLQYHIQPLSLERFGEPLHTFPAFTASVCNLRPTSRGSIRIASADSRVPPKIVPNYLSTVEDRRVAVAALALTRRIVAASPLAKYQPEEIKPGLQFQTPEELTLAAGMIGTTIFHPVGTCRMGPDGDESAVVDSHLRVKGVARLRVVDASVMPYITSGNTNAPTLMIAERAAQLIISQNG